MHHFDTALAPLARNNSSHESRRHNSLENALRHSQTPTYNSARVPNSDPLGRIPSVTSADRAVTSRVDVYHAGVEACGRRDGLCSPPCGRRSRPGWTGSGTAAGPRPTRPRDVSTLISALRPVCQPTTRLRRPTDQLRWRKVPAYTELL